ncbi:MAG TPA: DUF4157 domain-containing protein [Thermoanaerobaculia bacterium]|nr:DUF4157 domain-containing protein [Thermoanaerobaculia bacterium]
MRTVLPLKPFPEKPAPVQPKLRVNPPGDRFEREADRVADQVVRGSGAVQRQVDPVQGQELDGAIAPPAVQDVVSSPGQPLDPGMRGLMEERFGHDFGRVRVHSDAKASESAWQIDASAYTSGSDIVFGAGRYETGTAAGQRLLAHELTHVVQQTGGGAPAGQTIQRQPASSPGSFPDLDLRENMSPSMASALGSAVVDKFALGSAKIPTAGEDSLRSSAENILFFIQKHPGATVHITGHTDLVDTEARNLTLGQERADAVSAFLQKEGVPAEMISTESKGESAPVVPTKEGVAEPRNRRVTVYFRVNKIPLSLGLDIKLKPPMLAEEPPPKKPNLGIQPGDIPIPEPPTLDDKMRELERQLKKTKPPERKSLSDVVIDGVMDTVVTPILRKTGLSDKRRKQAESLIRKGLEKGTEKACEAPIDALDIGSAEKEALKASCKAAIKQK